MTHVCPLCGTVTGIRHHLGGYDIRRCPDCGFHGLDPQPTPEAQADMFEDEAAYYRDILEREDALRRTYRDTLQRLERHVRPGRLLDVGCGNGILLEVAAARGWRPEGVEVSEYAAGLARRRTGLPIHSGWLDQLGLPAESFDAIVLTQVVEHLVDPTPLLATCAGLLRAGGVIVVATPNPESWLATARGERFNYWLVPAHATLYSPRALERLLTRSGLRPLGTRTWSSHEPDLDDRLDVLAATALPRRLRRGRPARLLAAPLGWLMDASGRGTITEGLATRQVSDGQQND